MKRIFVSSPYAGDIEKNVEFAKKACRFVIEKGEAFFCPHLLYPLILDDCKEEERQMGIEMGLEFLAKCDEMCCFGDRISAGMFEEIEFARRNGIPVKRIINLEAASMDDREKGLILQAGMHQ